DTCRRRVESDRSKPRNARDATVAGVTLTHADRVVYPARGIQRDLALFYESIAGSYDATFLGNCYSVRSTARVRRPLGSGTRGADFAASALVARTMPVASVGGLRCATSCVLQSISLP